MLQALEPVIQGVALIFLGLALLSPSLAGRLRHRFLRRFFKRGLLELSEWKKRGVQAGFTTRHFPLVLHRTDDLLDEGAQKKFFASMPFRKCALLGQVHGDGIAALEDPARYAHDGFYHFPDTDAAVTPLKELALLVFSADCLSIYVSAGDWIGLAHAG